MAQYVIRNIILILFLQLISGNIEMVKGSTCSLRNGECKTDCAERCKQMHEGYDGKCDRTFYPPLCTCYYDCPSPSSPPKLPLADRCHQNNGQCNHEGCGDDCCNANCKDKFAGATNVVGTCQDIIGTPYRLCLCEYDC
ncbi:hypothetical protein RDABS01_009394 [Bienertia sinuspersici]